MTDTRRAPSPTETATRLVRNGWNSLHTVYYANTVSWRVLKSGALLFLGFFLWAGGNVLLSYRPAWTWLRFPAAYGLVLVAYGPVHHLVVIPLALRWRRRGEGRLVRVGRRLPNAGLAGFLAAVVVLAALPGLGAPVTVDFGRTLDGTAADVDPDLLCTKADSGGETVVHCHLTTAEGVDSVVVESGDRRVVVDEDPPFDVTFSATELESVVGQKQFQVVLRDAEGETVRRYTRTLSMVDDAD
jgi:hypothetical protein